MENKSSSKTYQESNKIFRPYLSCLLNWVLTVNVFLLFIYGTDLLPGFLIILCAVLYNVVFILGWFFWAKNFFSVSIQQGEISGPSKGLKRVTFKLREVDHHKKHRQQNAFLRMLYREVWSVDQKLILLYRFILDERQIIEISETIDKYPFRAS